MRKTMLNQTIASNDDTNLEPMERIDLETWCTIIQSTPGLHKHNTNIHIHIYIHISITQYNKT